MANLLTYFLFLLATSFLISPASASLQPLRKAFYLRTCPAAESIVRSTIRKALLNDPGLPASLIRLHFHDCFVRGCDASILLDSTSTNKAEKEDKGNYGVKGFEVIDEIKAKLEAHCPNTVSCSDILAFAARDGVTLSGGFHYDVPAGRRDGRVSSAAEVGSNLPSPYYNVSQLRDTFASKGLSLEKMVTLSGAHSIGVSHCSSFSKRVYNYNATFAQDPSIVSSHADFLRSKCPRPLNSSNSSSASDDPLVAFDSLTPYRLDGSYYKELGSGKGLLYSDQVLWRSDLTRRLVKQNVHYPIGWTAKFSAAMVNMGSIDVLTGKQGEIRNNCRVVN